MKFRRKSAPVPDAEPAEVEADAEAAPDEPTGVAGTGSSGPIDAEDLPDDGVPRVDLGSLLIHPEDGRALRVQVDERTGEVQAIVLAGADGGLELRAFAAPRHGDLWSEVRPQLAADVARRGGTATEQEGPFGTELLVRITASRPDGQKGEQVTRFIGVNGSRWMLRASLMGRPAVDPEAAAAWEATLAKVAVRRGTEAMAPGEALPVRLPEEMRRITGTTA